MKPRGSDRRKRVARPPRCTDTHQSSVCHCLELQEEDALLAWLSGGASRGRTVVVSQKEAVTLSP